MLRQVSSQDIAHTREALEELVQSDGWKIFVARLRQEYEGPGYVVRMGQAISNAKKGDSAEPEVVHRVAQEMRRLSEWPNRKIEELKGSPDNE